MSDAATAQRQPIPVEYLEPATLLVDKNVRIDNRVDKDFIASIKDLGVLVPIVAVRTAEGAVRVRFGHRRTLAAIEAGVATVPVMVVADEGTDNAAQIDRIVSQYAENTQRTGLSRSDEIGVVASLLDLGLSAAQVAKRTCMRRPAVDAAVTIVGSELAQAATARYDFLTLDQAAALAEFQDDNEAVKMLVVAAQAGEVRFDHTLQELRDSRVARVAQIEARKALEETGITVVDEVPWTHQLRYLTSAEGAELTEDAHRECPGHGAYLNLDWVQDESADNDVEEVGDDHYRPVWQTVYVCTDPEANGHESSIRSASSTSQKPAVDPEEAKKQRRRVIENNKAWRSAETVRREWLTNLLARKAPPKGALRFVLGELATAHWRLTNKIGQGHELACRLLGIDGGREALGAAMAAASDNRAQVIALALVLGAYEDFTSVDTWRNPTPQDRDYLNTLVEWGYELSEIEVTVLGDTKAD